MAESCIRWRTFFGQKLVPIVNERADSQCDANLFEIRMIISYDVINGRLCTFFSISIFVCLAVNT